MAAFMAEGQQWKLLCRPGEEVSYSLQTCIRVGSKPLSTATYLLSQTLSVSSFDVHAGTTGPMLLFGMSTVASFGGYPTLALRSGSAPVMPVSPDKVRLPSDVSLTSKAGKVPISPAFFEARTLMCETPPSVVGSSHVT